MCDGEYLVDMAAPSVHRHIDEQLGLLPRMALTEDSHLCSEDVWCFVMPFAKIRILRLDNPELLIGVVANFLPKHQALRAILTRVQCDQNPRLAGWFSDRGDRNEIAQRQRILVIGVGGESVP